MKKWSPSCKKYSKTCMLGWFMSVVATPLAAGITFQQFVEQNKNAMNGCWLIKTNPDGTRVGFKVNALTCQRGSRTDGDRDLAITRDSGCNWCEGVKPSEQAEFFTDTTDSCTIGSATDGTPKNCATYEGNFNIADGAPTFQFCPTNSLNLSKPNPGANPQQKTMQVLNPYCSYCYFDHGRLIVRVQRLTVLMQVSSDQRVLMPTAYVRIIVKFV